MEDNNNYQLLFIYTCDYDFEKTFTFSRVELASDYGLILTGDNAGNLISDIYEECKDTRYTNTEAFKKGLVISYSFSANGENNNLRDIVEETYSYLLEEYDIRAIDNKEDKVYLDKVVINVSNEERTLVKKNHAAKITQMLFYNKLQMIKQKKKLEGDFKVVHENNLEEDYKSENEKKKTDVKQLILNLKRKVISQDEAINKIVPSILINQKLATLNNKDIIKTQKSAILISGSTGTGKTLIVEELCQMLDIPMVVRGITNYSPVGYKGDSLNTILSDLYNMANKDLEKAQKGVVCFDEIDKLGDTNLEIRKGIAHELLTWLNGTTITINEDKKNEAIFDTSKLTFIGLGAFEKIREKKKNTRTIGFNVSEQETKEFSTEDFIETAGMQRELMGRFNCMVTMNDFSVEDLKKILIESDLSPLKSFVELANLYGVTISYDDEFIEKIARLAYKEKIGARALQRQINNVKNEYIIDIISESIDHIDLSERRHKKILEL